VGHGGPDWLNPARRGTISFAESGPALGAAGQLAKRVAEKFKFRQDVFLAESISAHFTACITERRTIVATNRCRGFPAVERDFSLFLADGVTFGRVQRTIQSLGMAENRVGGSR
jgi:phenylalanyl-tRNA synthetase beta subunit